MIELHQTQYPGTENKPKRAVFIGLDFGTAFTKVVIAGTSDSFAIKLRPKFSGIDAYLQPGVLAIDENGVYQIPSGDIHYSYLDNLKLTLIENPGSANARINAAIFLALVIQRARTSFMEKQKGIFNKNQLVWHMNIGLPAASVEDDALRSSFHKVACMGWLLSVLGRPITINDNAFLQQIDQEDDHQNDPALNSLRGRLLDPSRIEIIPEVQAMTASYTASKSCQKCLHLLVDVGAGTLDINIFCLVGLDSENRYVCHTAKVLPLGRR